MPLNDDNTDMEVDECLEALRVGDPEEYEKIHYEDEELTQEFIIDDVEDAKIEITNDAIENKIQLIEDEISNKDIPPAIKEEFKKLKSDSELLLKIHQGHIYELEFAQNKLNSLKAQGDREGVALLGSYILPIIEAKSKDATTPVITERVRGIEEIINSSKRNSSVEDANYAFASAASDDAQDPTIEPTSVESREKEEPKVEGPHESMSGVYSQVLLKLDEISAKLDDIIARLDVMIAQKQSREEKIKSTGMKP